MEKHYISLAELSNRISLSKRTIRELIRQPDDAMPAICIGTKLLFPWADVCKWLNKHRIENIDTNAVVNEILHSIEKEV